jgi:lipopolysaccharide/colanic/teichoic acid biosynthesis glycosyltransferase
MATHKLSVLPWIRDDFDQDVQNNPEMRLALDLIPEAIFIRMLRLERRRTERSGRPFVLVLISGDDLRENPDDRLVACVVSALVRTTRETDILGWYKRYKILGLLMPEIGQVDSLTIETITSKIIGSIQKAVTQDRFARLIISFRIFPEPIERSADRDSHWICDTDRLDFEEPVGTSRRILKRSLDIAGSLFALTAFLPIFVIIGILVKLSSRGPIFFCQKRVGQYGREFNFYKFRTMYTDNDPSIHQEYVAKLIAGTITGTGVYKIEKDPRITTLGTFLRKTSFDELPQFFNVLRNDMSLVGPRPPLPYEFDRYQMWHKRRVLELKPGLTGPWQVHGRSRTTFDEMVRMDLQYATKQSLWFDLRILLQTPAAMFSGKGAC